MGLAGAARAGLLATSMPTHWVQACCGKRAAEAASQGAASLYLKRYEGESASLLQKEHEKAVALASWIKTTGILYCTLRVVAPTIRTVVLRQFEDICTCAYYDRTGLATSREDCPEEYRVYSANQLERDTWPDALLRTQHAYVLIVLIAQFMYLVVLLLLYRFASHSGKLENAVEAAETRKRRLWSRLRELRKETLLPLRTLQSGIGFVEAQVTEMRERFTALLRRRQLMRSGSGTSGSAAFRQAPNRSGRSHMAGSMSSSRLRPEGGLSGLSDFEQAE